MPIEARQRFSLERTESLADRQAVDDGGVLGLLHELLDREVVGHPHEPQALHPRYLKGLRADRNVRTVGNVLLDDLPEVHAVELVPGEDQDQVVGILAEVDQVPAHGVRRALVPVEALLGLLGREDVDKPPAEGVELVGALHVAVQRRRIELREQENPVNVRVDAVADRNVHQPVFAGEGHRRLAAFIGQRR